MMHIVNARLNARIGRTRLAYNNRSSVVSSAFCQQQPE